MYRRRSAPKRRKRSIRRVRGRGSYWKDALNIGLNTGGMALGAAGGALYSGGNPYASWAGGTLGGAAGKGIAEAIGVGAYHVKANSLVKIDEGSSVPAFGNMSFATRIKHREYITDITSPGTNAFTLSSFPINPGVSTTFPWLSGLANNYQQYQIIGMIFEFVSTSSEYNNNVSMGSVIMATDYDAVDNPFVSKLAMENSQYCVSDKPSNSNCHIIECAPQATANPIRYIRIAAVTAGTDARQYDMGLFQIATQGMLNIAAGTTIGELWVTYDVALYKPQLNSGLVGLDILYDQFTVISSKLSTVTATDMMGTTPYPLTTGNIGGVLTGNLAYAFPGSLNGGKYLFRYVAFGTAAALAVAFGAVTGTNCTVTNVGGGPRDAQTAAAVASIQFYDFYVTITAPNAIVTYGTQGTSPTAVTYAALKVIQVPTLMV